MCVMRKSTLIDNMAYRQFAKFCAVGVLNTAVQYSVFYGLLHVIRINYLMASAVGYCVGLTNSYMFNRKWTFSGFNSPNMDIEFIKFVTVNVAALAINLGSLRCCVSILHLRPEIGQIIAIPLSTTVNFLGNKFWTFRLKTTRQTVMCDSLTDQEPPCHVK